MQNKYELCIAIRIYPKVSKIPHFYSDNKLKITELCLQSMKLSLGTMSVKIYFILDGCPNEYENLVLKYFSSEDSVIINTSSIGNKASFKKQLDILSTQTDAEHVYFAEDDYLYVPGQFKEMLEFINENKNADFITCYDHLDYYNHPIHNYPKKTIKFNSADWKMVGSTCCTFLTTKKTLNRTKRYFMTYAKGNNDCAMWLSLTKKHIYNPFAYLKFFLKDEESFNILKTGIKYGFINYFCFKKYNIWVKTPSIGTHLESSFLAPQVDWDLIKRQTESSYK